MKKSLIVHGLIPHYREKVFNILAEDFDFLIYDKKSKGILDTKGYSSVRTYSLPFGFSWISVNALYSYENIILPMELKFLPTIFSLLFMRKRTVLWGQGCNQHRNWSYFPYFFHILLAKRVLFYCPRELKYWQNIFPGKRLDSVNNAVDGLPSCNNNKVRESLDIPDEAIVLLSSYRFENPLRNDHLYLDLIQDLEDEGIYFIIIGDGSLKPDFSGLSNVREVGALYRANEKSPLFGAADFYIQLGWNGLSIVEAVKSGLPVVTLRESPIVKHCVEHQYLTNSNSYIFDDISSILRFLVSIKKRNQIIDKQLVMDSLSHLSEENMARRINRFLHSD